MTDKLMKPRQKVVAAALYRKHNEIHRSFSCAASPSHKPSPLPPCSSPSLSSGEESPPTRPRVLTEMLVLAFAIGLTLLLNGAMVALLIDRQSWLMRAFFPRAATKDEDW